MSKVKNKTSKILPFAEHVSSFHAPLPCLPHFVALVMAAVVHLEEVEAGWDLLAVESAVHAAYSEVETH